MALFHQAHNTTIEFVYRKHNFNPQSLECEADLERLPFIMVAAMKRFLFDVTAAERGCAEAYFVWNQR